MEECVACGFGLTSQEGATSREECRPVQQACPIGQWAPPDAVSKEMCQCYRGFGGAVCVFTFACRHKQFALSVLLATTLLWLVYDWVRALPGRLEPS
jgi:hypothetical protein